MRATPSTSPFFARAGRAPARSVSGASRCGRRRARRAASRLGADVHHVRRALRVEMRQCHAAPDYAPARTADGHARGTRWSRRYHSRHERDTRSARSLLLALRCPACAGARAEPARSGRHRAGRALAAAGAADRREHHARDPPRPGLRRRSGDHATTSQSVGQRLVAVERRGAPGLRVLRRARQDDQRVRDARRLHRRAHRPDRSPRRPSPSSPRCSAHEIAHVLQRHIARQLRRAEPDSQLPLIALGARDPGGRSNPQARAGARSRRPGGAGGGVLSYTRDFEREADRVGFQICWTGPASTPRACRRSSSGCSRATRLYDNNAPIVPAHPPAHRRAHRRHAEPARGRAVPAAPRQHRVPAGAREAARRRGHAARTRWRTSARARRASASRTKPRPRATATPRRCCAPRTAQTAEREIGAAAQERAAEPDVRDARDARADRRRRRRGRREDPRRGAPRSTPTTVASLYEYAEVLQRLGEPEGGDRRARATSSSGRTRARASTNMIAKSYAALGKRTAAAPRARRGLLPAGQPAGGDRAARSSRRRRATAISTRSRRSTRGCASCASRSRRRRSRSAASSSARRRGRIQAFAGTSKYASYSRSKVFSLSASSSSSLAARRFAPCRSVSTPAASATV